MTESERKELEFAMESFMVSGRAYHMTPSQIGSLFGVSKDKRMMIKISSWKVKHTPKGFPYRGRV